MSSHWDWDCTLPLGNNRCWNGSVPSLQLKEKPTSFEFNLMVFKNDLSEMYDWCSKESRVHWLWIWRGTRVRDLRFGWISGWTFSLRYRAMAGDESDGDGDERYEGRQRTSADLSTKTRRISVMSHDQKGLFPFRCRWMSSCVGLFGFSQSCPQSAHTPVIRALYYFILLFFCFPLQIPEA